MHENEGKNDLLRFIAQTVETMRDRMGTMDGRMATMEERMVTMDGRMATMEGRMGTMDERMVTMEGHMVTMEGRMATKSDLGRLEEKMEAGFTAVRGDIERVSLRLDTIERALSARLSLIETEVSRLRSVVYLLVKDQPELLRLLGTEPPLV